MTLWSNRMPKYKTILSPLWQAATVPWPLLDAVQLDSSISEG